MDSQQKKELLTLARQTLENELLHTTHDLEKYNRPEYEEDKGVFVSLHIKGELRGCIGRIEAVAPLYDNVIDLAKAAAFEDHRFSNLTVRELEKVQIEISILSKPQPVTGKNNQEKIGKIIPERDGVVLRGGNRGATFLPQVWEAVPEKEQFISELCRKAGLTSDYWKHGDLELSVYQVENFEEEQ